MKISIIVAMTKDYVIWKNNDLPRSYPEDLKRFKKLTSGHTIIMWSKTYHSIWHPLPNRRNIVLSRSNNNIDGVEIYHSIESLLDQLISENLPKDEEIFIIGWSTIYSQFLDKCDFIYLTEIKETYDWDTFFPKFLDSYEEIEREKHEQFDFVKYQFIS